MKRNFYTTWMMGCAVLMLAGISITGCEGPTKPSAVKTPSGTIRIVTPRREIDRRNVVRVYSLRDVGLKDADEEIIRDFTETIRRVVVTDNWKDTHSSIHVFDVLMTIRTTRENHHLIQEYMEQVSGIMAAAQ